MQKTFWPLALTLFATVGPARAAANMAQIQAAVQNGDRAGALAEIDTALARDPEDVEMLASRDVSIVWAPRRNISLYGMTAPATVFDNLGVNIALGSDWLPSGSINLLRELQCAKSLSSTYYASQLSDHDLAGMVTWIAA